MPVICPNCKEVLDAFNDKIFADDCRVCGESLKKMSEEEMRQDNLKWVIRGMIYGPLEIGTAVVLGNYDYGLPVILLGCLAVLVVCLLGQSAWYWIWHRNDPPGLKLK